MMEKKLIEADQLSQWLTDKMRKEPGCQSCLILKVCKKDEADGCNWCIAAFVSHDPEPEIVADALVKVHRLAAERFNLM